MSTTKRFMATCMMAASLFTMCACGSGNSASTTEETMNNVTSTTEQSQPENWLDAVSDKPFAVFDFSEGKDMYGDKTVNIIGDCLSQGLNSDLF